MYITAGVGYVHNGSVGALELEDFLLMLRLEQPIQHFVL